MDKSVLCLLIFLTCVISPSLPAKLVRENANEFVDTGLGILRNKYKDPMTPIKMKDRTIGLNHSKFMLIPLEAMSMISEVRIEDFYVTKIGNLKRIGNATMTVIPPESEDDEESTVTHSKVGIYDIEINATIVFDVMRVSHREPIEGSVKFLGTQIILTTNGTTGERDIPYFNVYDISGVDIQFIGPYQKIDAIRNVPLRLAVNFVMNTQLKRIVQVIITRAGYAGIREIATF